MTTIDADWVLDLSAFRPSALGYSLMRVRCDANRHAYVVDADNGKILKFDDQGRRLAVIPSDDALHRLHNPRDVAIDSVGNVLIADWMPGTEPRVVVCDAGGGWRYSFILDGPPGSLAVDPTGSIYVHVLTSGWRVHKYTQEGKLVLRFGERPRQPRRRTQSHAEAPGIHEPLSLISVGSSGRIYFAPSWIYDVRVFDAEGRPLGALKRRIRERVSRGRVPGEQQARTLRSLVLQDLSTPHGGKQVFVLRGRSPRGQALVDAWSSDGRRHGPLLLAQRGHSIAVDDHLGLYLLHRSVSGGAAQLMRYRIPLRGMARG